MSDVPKHGGRALDVLVVNEDTMGADLVQAILSGADEGAFRVSGVKSLAEMFDRLHAGRCDIVLIDSEAPTMHVLDALLRVRHTASSVPMVTMKHLPDEQLGLREILEGAKKTFPQEKIDEFRLDRAIRSAIERFKFQEKLLDHNVELKREAAQLAVVVDLTPDGLAVVSTESRVLLVNEAMAAFLDAPRAELVGSVFPHAFAVGGTTTVEAKRQKQFELTATPIEWDGETATALVLREARHDPPQGQVATVEPKARPVETREGVRVDGRRVHLDSATGLMNRLGLEWALLMEIYRAKRMLSRLTAVVIECEEWSRVEEEVGAAALPDVLKEVGRRLRGAQRFNDHLGYLGDHSFLALLPETGYWEAVSISKRFTNTISASAVEAGSAGETWLEASVGMWDIDLKTSSLETVIERTGKALKTYRDTGTFSVIGGGAKTLANMSEEERDAVLAQLCKQETYRAVALPIYDLAVEEVIGYELLSRANNVGGLSAPMAFLQASLEEDSMTLVDTLCLRTCALASRKLGDTGRLHFNLFASTVLATPTQTLLDLLGDLGSRCCLEVSEQQVIGDCKVLNDRLKPLRDAGIQIVMEDAACGRSSLEVLILLRPDAVKIKPAFIRGVGRDVNRQRVLRKLTKLVSSMGADLIAEGIESRSDLKMLKKLGLLYGQGFLWGKPAPVEEFEH